MTLNLASPLDMNRVEKEEFVIRLYKENRSTRSFRDIGAITKKAESLSYQTLLR